MTTRKQRNIGTLRLARQVEGVDDNTFTLVDTKPFSNMREVQQYLRNIDVDEQEEFLVVRTVTEATVSPTTRTTVTFSS